MLLNAHSIEYKVVLVSIWSFPFLVLAVLTRDFFLWCTRLVSSVTAVFLFALSFLLFMIIIMTDFEHGYGMHMSTQEILQRAFYGTVFFFPGLVLVILLGALAAIFKPDFPNVLGVGLLAMVFHLLYLWSVVVLSSQ
jgi:hypothetical protein